MKTDRREFIKYVLGGVVGAVLAPAIALRAEEPEKKQIKPDPTLTYWVQVPARLQDDCSPIAYRVAKQLPGDLATIMINGWPYPAEVRYKRHSQGGYELRLKIREFYPLGAFVRWKVLIRDGWSIVDDGFVLSVAHDVGSPTWEITSVDPHTFLDAFDPASRRLLFARYIDNPEKVRREVADTLQRVQTYAWTQRSGRKSATIRDGRIWKTWYHNELWHGASWRPLHDRA